MSIKVTLSNDHAAALLAAGITTHALLGKEDRPLLRAAVLALVSAVHPDKAEAFLEKMGVKKEAP